MIDPELRALLIAPPIETSTLEGIGGRIRVRDEDFVVDEVPAYPPDGTADRHLLVRIEKLGLSTDEAVREICRQVGVSRRDAGVAGKKDKHALTRQWISLPAAAAGELGRFRHDAIRVLEVEGHRHKLRRGHNRGNRFEIVVRDPDCAPEEALARARAKARTLSRGAGLLNHFGDQRFGRAGENLDRGLAALREGRRAGLFELSAGQSALFNLHLLRRREEGEVDRVLAGDLVRKTDTGGMFEVEEVEAEQARMDRGELVVTGPIFGSKMRSPAEGSPAWRREQTCLEEAAIAPETLRGFGKKLPGTRRDLRVQVDGLQVEADSTEGLPPGVRIVFALPSGSYATRLVSEFQEGGRVRPVKEEQ